MPNKNGWRDLSFQGKSAVVTGAARGIGRAVAYRLAGLGARTVIWDLDGEVAEQAAGELRQLLASQGRANRLEWKQVDITDPETVASSMEEAASGDGLDVLVNNAGTTSVQQTETMPLDVWDRTLRINLSGTFYCCRAAIPHLKRKPGADLWLFCAVQDVTPEKFLHDPIFYKLQANPDAPKEMAVRGPLPLIPPPPAPAPATGGKAE